MSALSTAEISSLTIIDDQEAAMAPCRKHLEKFSRLDLIEPCAGGMRLSDKGRKLLEQF